MNSSNILLNKMKKTLPLILIILFSFNIYGKNVKIHSEDPKSQNISNLVDFSDIIPDLLPTVVNISTSKEIKEESPSDIEELLKILPDDSKLSDLTELLQKQIFPTEESHSSGSGFIISEDGYIVTNEHVIDGADKIFVSLQNGEKILAKLIGADARTDLALLKINFKDKLPFTKFADSDQTKIGQWIIAVGNPFGLGGSVSAGIISANNRDINKGQINNFIQTDAAINKGNSGGPLFNIKGQVIAIATAIYSPSGGNVGIGFATPSNIAQEIIPNLKKNGAIKRGYLGVSVQEITKEIANSLDINQINGAMVVQVFPDSPAADANILLGDIITKFNGQKINKMKELPLIVAKTKIGEKIKIEVIRGKKKKILKVKIAELGQEKKKLDPKNIKNILGMDLKKIDDEIRKEHKLDEDLEGLIVQKVNNNSSAKSKQILKDDILLFANQEKLKSINILEKIIKKAQKNKKDNILLIIKRGEDNFALILPIQTIQ
jgi:serine protease Do